MKRKLEVSAIESHAARALALLCIALILSATLAATLPVKADARQATQAATRATSASGAGGGTAPTAPAITTMRASATVAVNTAAAPKVGDAAPDFRLPYATQEKIFFDQKEQMTLASLRGKNVILAFYPADWSGGCTKEVCTLRDTFAELSKLNATVLGISGDYVFSHQEWAKHHNLQFPLVSDHKHEVARTYGIYDEASGFNKRSVFLIDKNGVVRYTNLAFKAGEQKDYEALRAALQKLQ
ncbi:MAG: peroxiredoxin [Acidobacteria bacterium]|nr:peroxiredoxin [Acidobacteriota bacterium]